MTGLPDDAARFQARSAFTGTGFTTSETCPQSGLDLLAAKSPVTVHLVSRRGAPRPSRVHDRKIPIGAFDLGRTGKINTVKKTEFFGKPSPIRSACQFFFGDLSILAVTCRRAGA